MSAKTDEELNPDPDDVAGPDAGSGVEDSPSPKAEAPKTAAAATKPAQEEKEGGLGPAILAGVGILAVVAALVFWPSDDDDAKKAGADGKTSAAAAQGRAGADDPDGASAKGPGGVAARNVDDASRKDGEEAGAGGELQSKINPAVRFPRGMGLAPAAPPDEPPPTFASKEDEITWWEGKLVRATSQLEMRKKATERLAKWKEKAEASENAEQELARYDQRAEVVHENFKKAQSKVAEVEKKLAELRAK